MEGLFAVCVMLVGLLVAPSSSSSVAKLPPYLKACHRSDPNLNACALKSTRDAQSHIVKGEPSLHIPVIEPLRLDRLTVNQGSGPVRFQLTLTDLYLHGLSRADIHAMDFDLKNKLAETRFTVPGRNIDLKAKYKIEGQVLILPIKGDGDLKINLDTLNATFKTSFDLVKMSDGLTHMKFKDSSFDYDAKRTYFDFKNLFNGDKTLGEGMNVFLNENWQEVHKEVKPAVAEVSRKTLVHLLSEIATVLPYDVMFPA